MAVPPIQKKKKTFCCPSALKTGTLHLLKSHTELVASAALSEREAALLVELQGGNNTCRQSNKQTNKKKLKQSHTSKPAVPATPGF